MPLSPVPKRRGRILLTLLALLLGLSVVPLLLISRSQVERSREIIELDQKHMQLDKAQSLSQQAAAYVQSLDQQVDAIARTLEVDSGPFPPRMARIRESRALERYVSGEIPFYWMSLVDATCRGTGSGLTFREPLIEQSLYEGCQRGIQGQSYQSDPLLSSSLKNEPVMVFGEPVKPGGAAVHGVILAVASLSFLSKITREQGQGGSEVYIVDRRGHLIAHSVPARLEGDLDVSGVEIVERFLETRGRTALTTPFEVRTSTGIQKMLGTCQSVPDTQWGVIVQVDLSKAYHPATEMERDSFLRMGLVALLAILLGLLFAGEISRPIQQLARGARRLASGDYGTRVSVKSSNEVGELADTFNQMGEEIQKAIEEIRAAATKNKELFLGAVKMLANAIDEKDPYTRGHSERVAFYSQMLAKHLGMSEAEIERVYLAGILHDVGKIGIEDKILRKASALTDDEYEIMKQHPRKGEHILEAVPDIKAIAGDGLMHHENVDGSGYPDGLKGAAIPLLGRIVSVADAFDAMTTDRPYSKAMTFQAAVARLRVLAGKKFDVECVEAAERAFAAGDLAPSKARRASVVARQPPPTPEPEAGRPQPKKGPAPEPEPA